MNLLEHYIEVVHDEVLFDQERDLVEVDITVNCYGAVERKTYTFNKSNWEFYKQRGYFLA